MVFALGRLDEVLAATLSGPEPAILAKHAFTLAQRFHRFYDNYRLLGEPEGARRNLRAAVIALYLDIFNLFVMLLYVLGGRRSD